MSSCTHVDKPPDKARSKNLKKGMFLTGVYFFVELFIGILGNSVSMVGDSFHMLTDLIVQVMTYKSRDIRNNKPGDSFVGYLSFGPGRIEVIVTIFNCFLLLAVKAWMLYRVCLALIYGQPEINGLLVFVTAVIGYVINKKVHNFWHVHEHDHSEDGVKSAMLHIKDDIYGSMAVMASSLVIFVGLKFFNLNLYWVDSVAALVVVGLLVKRSINLLLSGLGTIMEAVPKGVVLEEVEKTIAGIDGILGVPDLHIFKVRSGMVVVLAKIEIKKGLDFNQAYSDIKNRLSEKFHELEDAHYFIQPIFTKNLP